MKAGDILKADLDSTVLYQTHIDGFDEVLDGGIPRGHITLISGAPGTMKSSLAYYILFKNATEGGIPGAYITLEQSRESLLFQMERLQLKGAPENKLQVVDVGGVRKNVETEESREWLDMLKNHILYLKKTYKIELLVLDSLQALNVLGDLKGSRSVMFRFFEWLRGHYMTTYILNESRFGSQNEPTTEEYLADGIIHLSLVKVGKFDFHRRIRCIKMRGMHHTMAYYSLDYVDGQFIVTSPI